MPLNVAERSMIKYDIGFGNSDNSSRTKREKVEDAATATGAAGAGVAATRGGGTALKFFKSAENMNYATGVAAHATKAVEEPVRKSRSLFNAFKINNKTIGEQISAWAERTNMPNFMKAMFKGSVGKFLGRGAAVFVFITGIGEVFHTLMKNLNNVGEKMSRVASNPYTSQSYDKYEYMDPREVLYWYMKNQAKYDNRY